MLHSDQDMMEDKRLNYYQPLISVRRSPSPAPSEKGKSGKLDHSLPKNPTIPFYKSELNSGPVINAEAVPFVWEQCPGRPKDETKFKNHTYQSPVINPKLPPGMLMEMRKQMSQHSSGSKQHKKVPCGLHSVSVPIEYQSKVEITEDAMKIEDSDAKEGDEESLDALNTSPRTESFYRISGKSKLDASSVDTYGNFATDPHTRDLLIDRFLPAAKAKNSDAPQYCPRKQPTVQEQPRQLEKIVCGDKSPQLRYGPNVVPHYTHDNGEEESDDDYDVDGQLPSKACGLLPHFCLKNSILLLNPLPGTRGKNRVKISCGSRTKENENEGIKDTVYQQRPIGDLQISKHKDTLEYINQSEHNCFFPKKLEGTDLHKRVHQNNLSQSTCSAPKPLSSYDYELPKNAFSEQRRAFKNHVELKNAMETGVSTNGKGYMTFKDLLADPNSFEEVETECLLSEKTMHVDGVHKVEDPRTYWCGWDTKEHRNLNADVLKDDKKCKTVENTNSADHSCNDAQNFTVQAKEENITFIAQKHVDDFSAVYLPERSKQVSATKVLKDFTQCRSPTNNISTSMKSEAHDNVNNGSESQQTLFTEDVHKPKVSYAVLSSPPPLPKSPSDSWLSRTLPTIASKKPHLKAPIDKRTHISNHVLNTSSIDHKWETIVRSTRDHHRQELLASIPEA